MKRSLLLIRSLRVTERVSGADTDLRQGSFVPEEDSLSFRPSEWSLERVGKWPCEVGEGLEEWTLYCRPRPQSRSTDPLWSGVSGVRCVWREVVDVVLVDPSGQSEGLWFWRRVKWLSQRSHPGSVDFPRVPCTVKKPYFHCLKWKY